MLGDLEFFANVLGMSHWNSDELCWACDASKKDAARDWQCNWANRGWTLRDPADYKFNTLHPLFKLPGVTSWCVCFDQLHCLDNHGVASHLVGSSLHQMIYTKVRGKAANEELARLWRRIGELYRELGIEERLTNLTLAMLCNVDKPHANYPTLKAKAAETRHLVPVMAKLLVEEDDGSDVSQHRIQAIQALCSFYTILESQPMCLPPSASNAVMKTMETLLLHYAWLHDDALGKDQWLYNMVPKCHYSWHLAYNCRFMNARFSWTYKCESWVGKVSHIAASCAAGTSLTKLSVPLADKYRMLVHVRISRCVFDE